MEGLDSLVKLASIGTAGVCILIVFVIGVSLFKMSNNISREKVALIKKYMNLCVIIAVICLISGVANAYFNKGKIDEAKQDLAQMTDAYDKESRKVETERAQISEALNSLQQQISTVHGVPPSVTTSLGQTEAKVKGLRLTPKEEILKNIQAKRLR